MEGLAYPLPEELSKLSRQDMTPLALELVRRHFLGPWLQERGRAHMELASVLAGMSQYRDYTPEEQSLAWRILAYLEDLGYPGIPMKEWPLMVLPGDPPNLVQWLTMTRKERLVSLTRCDPSDLSISIASCSTASPTVAEVEA